MLGAVLVAAGALDVAAAGDGDDHFFLGDEVFHGHVTVVAHEDLGAALIAEAGDDFGQLFRDDGALAILRGNNRVVLVNHAHELIVAILDLLAFQGGQTAQLHVQNRLGLGLVDVEEVHQAGAGVIGGGGAANQGDDLVEGIEGLEQAAQDMRFFFSLTQTVAGTAHDNFKLVVDPVADEGVQGEGAGHTVHNRQHVG